MPELFWTVNQALLLALIDTFKIFAFTLIFSIPLGLLIAFGSMSKIKLLKWLLDFVVWVFRGTPLMLQLFAVFYVPGLLFGHDIWGGSADGRMLATIVAFSLNYACYFSVIFRGGIISVPAGQREAGEVLGMTKSQIFFKITLLQMVKRVVPPMSNEIITLVKDTSLARVIGVVELTHTGYAYIKSAGLVWPLFYTAVFYLVFVGVLTILFNYIERRLDYFK